MSRLSPPVWATKKAAERWLAKTPPRAYRDINRVWGVLKTPFAGSDELVKGAGAAWGRSEEALAAVLKMAPDYIQVREAVGSEPLVTANMVPSPRPTRNPNPSPNTAVAAQPSNAAPDFPSGDN